MDNKSFHFLPISRKESGKESKIKIERYKIVARSDTPLFPLKKSSKGRTLSSRKSKTRIYQGVEDSCKKSGKRCLE